MSGKRAGNKHKQVGAKHGSASVPSEPSGGTKRRHISLEEEYEANCNTDNEDEEEEEDNHPHNNNNNEDDEDDDDDDEEELPPRRKIQGRGLSGGSHSGRPNNSMNRVSTNHTTTPLATITNQGRRDSTPVGTALQRPNARAISSIRVASPDEQEYINHLGAIGYHQTAASNKCQVKEYVGKTLFRRLKFISGDAEMETTGAIASLVMKHFDIKEKDRVEWWAKSKLIVHKEVRQRRNNLGAALRSAFKSKCNMLVEKGNYSMRRTYLSIYFISHRMRRDDRHDTNNGPRQHSER